MLHSTHIPANTKPSTVYQKLRDLVPDLSFNIETLLKQIWLGKICQRTHLVIIPSIKMEIRELAMQADNVWTLVNNSTGLPAVSHIPAPATPVNPPLAVASISKQQLSFQKTMLDALAGLTAQIAALRTSRSNDHHSSRRSSCSRSPSPRYDRSSQSSSRYRGYRSPSPYRVTRLYNGLCWYHHTFGDDARNCAPECSKATTRGNAK